jgi:hypothetical protein
MRASKKAASMRWASSKLQTRARILDAGLKAAQPRNWPAWLSTRTVSPASPPPLAMAPSKIQGWRRSKERSLPSRNRIIFMALLSRQGARAPAGPRITQTSRPPCPMNWDCNFRESLRQSQVNDF